MVELTWRSFDAIRELIVPNNRPYKIVIENVDNVTLVGGESVSMKDLTIVKLYFSDPRGADDFVSSYLVGSSYNGGRAIRLAD